MLYLFMLREGKQKSLSISTRKSFITGNSVLTYSLKEPQEKVRKCYSGSEVHHHASEN